MNYFIFHSQINLLLVPESDQTEQMTYIDQTWSMPQIGVRPPYYCNPIYEENYPLI